jgi:hypothetical protein
MQELLNIVILGRVSVRGLAKLRCVVLWSALAYNLMHFATALLT